MKAMQTINTNDIYLHIGILQTLFNSLNLLCIRCIDSKQVYNFESESNDFKILNFINVIDFFFVTLQQQKMQNPVPVIKKNHNVWLLTVDM